MNLENLSKNQLVELAQSLQQLEDQKKRRKIDFYLPDTGPLRRELYPKHVELINSHARERCFLAANRVGKTYMGAAIVSWHATGLYPEWYKGRKFSRPTEQWVVGKTSETTRNIAQKELLGGIGKLGTGMIPADCIVGTYSKPGVSAGIEIVKVKHFTDGVFDGYSEIAFKAVDQGFESFVGTHKDGAWFDEEGEPNLTSRVYFETVIRTMQTDKHDPESAGYLLFTFTADHGLTPLVEQFYSAEDMRCKNGGDKHVVIATLDDAVHLPEEEKERIKEECRISQPHLYEAKINGIPAIGTGAIFPVPDELLVVDPIELPQDFKYAYGMDSSFQGHAVVWGAYDEQRDIWYIYDEYFAKGVTAEIPAFAIQSKPYGRQIRGVIDPASEGTISLQDGRNLFDLYKRFGLDISLANNHFEYGIAEVLTRMYNGRLKIFSTCPGLLKQKRMYRRDENGKIVNKRAYHLLDALRYLIVSGISVAEDLIPEDLKSNSYNSLLIRKRCPITGY